LAIKFTAVVAKGPGWVTVKADDGQTYTLKGQNGWRSNNPGNLSYSSEAAAMAAGAIGVEYPHGKELPVAVFPDLATGQKAREALMTGPAYQNLSIGDAAAKWSVTPYGPALAKAAGVPITTKIRDLSPAQLQAVLAQQRVSEGNVSGKITLADGSPAPPAVAAQYSRNPPPLIANSTGAKADGNDLSAWERSGNQLPMPGRPAALMPNGQPTTAPAMVRLSGGGTIAVGLHPSPDGTHMLNVTDDGQGNAVVTKQLNVGEVPGVIDPLREKDAPTMAGGYIRDLAKQIASSPQAAAAADQITSTAQKAQDGASAIGADAAGAAGTLAAAGGDMLNKTGIANLFTAITGGGKPNAPVVAPPMNSTGKKADGTDGSPMPPLKNATGKKADGTDDLLNIVKARADKAQGIIPDNQLPPEQQSNFDTAMQVNGYRDIQEQMYNPKSTSSPTVAPVKASPMDMSQGGSRGNVSPTDLSTGGTKTNSYPGDSSTGGVSTATPATKPTTTYTYQQMQVANPDYLKYIAAQKADPIGPGPGSLQDFQAFASAASTRRRPLLPPWGRCRPLRRPRPLRSPRRCPSSPRRLSRRLRPTPKAAGPVAAPPRPSGSGYINAPNAAAAQAIHAQLLKQQIS
jgi:hypothetical protein